MASRTTVAARTTAALTGGGAADYASDLDMNNTLDGWVTVEVTGTKALLDSITLAFHAGSAVTPTGVISSGIAAITETITGATWTRVVTLRCNERYFRASVAGTGAGGPVGSDAVINYYYQPNALTSALRDGVERITS